ncbi:MAG: hypothetical protein FD161_1884 [Limisphaerales bacterium]|nr:MAG: hypothetical protein FD161_1884 [Limisphaerales bacterium]TXT49022.1 MAG: hypothetical protein FD140_3273 [Limisphaerales bacterium]
MKTLLPTMLALCLVACVAPQPLIPIAAKPEISVLHVSGKIVSVPPNSKWPASIKIGARFDYWAVLDNRVRDENPSPQEGSFPQKAWPARYDLRVGDFRFSSDRLNPPTFSVSTYHARQGSSDGYSISPYFHTPLPEAPELEAVSFTVSLRSEKKDQITTDQLPVRPIPIADLVGGNAPTFRGAAYLKTDHSDHHFQGDVDNFEVFQASADSPLKLR